MIYFIAYLIKGYAKKRHLELTRDLSNIFGIKDPNLTAPPHITIKAPFRIENIDLVENFILDIVKKLRKSKLKLESYGNFDKNVLFVNVKESQEMKNDINYFLKKLKDERIVEWKDHEVGNLKLHATLGKKDIKNKFEKIKEYLDNIIFSYDLEFDNIAILRHEKGKWQVHKEYEIA